MANEIIRLSGSKSKVVFKKKTQKDVELRVPDIKKAKLYIESKNKMELFLNRYEIDYLAIDTTNLNPEEVVEAMIRGLPSTLRAELQLDDVF